MSMRGIIALIVCLTIDTWESSQYSFFSHCFDISIYRSSSDFWLSGLDLIEYVIRREVSASTGRTYDITILMGSHNRIMRKRYKKATFQVYLFH